MRSLCKLWCICLIILSYSCQKKAFDQAAESLPKQKKMALNNGVAPASITDAVTISGNKFYVALSRFFSMVSTQPGKSKAIIL